MLMGRAGPSTINNVCDTRGQGVQLPSYRGVPLPQSTIRLKGQIVRRKENWQKQIAAIASFYFQQ